MIQPRNTLVVLRLIEKSSRQVGKLTIPTNTDNYTEAEVMAVGPGTVAADGGRSETFDLKPGQLVLVRHKEQGRAGMQISGLPHRFDDVLYHIYEQTNVFGIIAQPGEWSVADVQYDDPGRPKTKILTN